MLKSLLHNLPRQPHPDFVTHAAAIHLHRELKHMPLHLLGESAHLLLVAVLEHLLNDVVAKDVRHELVGVGHDFFEHLGAFLGRGSFQLVLDEARAMLVARKFTDTAIDVLEVSQKPDVYSPLTPDESPCADESPRDADCAQSQSHLA